MNRFSRSAAPLAMVVLLALSSVPAAAQEQTGNLYGTVTDPHGATLPGVRVEVSGIGAPRIQLTNDQGQFRFLNLDPGNYLLSASLDGYSTLKYPDVDVRVGRSTTLEITLPPAIGETITVTSESPLLDERKVSRGTTVSLIELEKIPSARDPWAIVTQTPGVLSDRINVGGNESGQQAVFVAPAASDDENSFAVDGVLITDMSAIGSSPTYYDFDQFEEMQVSTGGTDIEKVSAGASLNLVTKRGSNNPRGSARFLLTDADEQFGIFEQADADIGGELENGDGNGGCDATLNPDCRQTLDDTPGNSINEVVDFGFEAGGPIVRDKLWVWGSYGRNDIKQFAQTGDPDNTLLENSAVKLNGQPAPSNSAVASWNRGDKIKDGRRPGANFAIETTWDQTGPTEIWKLEDTHVFSSDFYLTGLYSYVDGGFALQSKGSSFPNPDLPILDEPLQDDDGIWHNSYYGGVSNRDTDNYQLDGSYFLNTGDLGHELKFGVSYRKFSVSSTFGFPGRNVRHRSCEALGNCAATDGLDRVEAFRISAIPHELEYTSGWLQDTLTQGKWTVNAGLRYDLQEGSNAATTVAANGAVPEILPALDFGGNDAGGFSWETISPRVGVTYALGAERKTLIRASYSRFAEQLSSANVTPVNPTGFSFVRLLFEDGNDDNIWEPGESATPILAIGFDPDDPTALVSPNRNDPNLDPSLTDEIAVGVEHALLPEFVVGLDVTWRKVTDIIDNRNLVIDETGTERLAQRDDYVFDHRITSDGGAVPNLPDGTPWSIDYYTLRPGVDFSGGVYQTNGDRELDYLGGSLSFTKRLSNRWMARGYVSYGETEWSVPDGFLRYDNPTDEGIAAGGSLDSDGEVFVVQSAGSGAFQDVLLQSTWSANLNGMYQVAPDRPWGFNVAGNLLAREGYPLAYYYTSPVADGTDVVGSAVGEVDQFRADDITSLDLRLEKDMQLTDSLSGILSLDAFNVTDEHSVLQRNRALNSPQANFLTQSLSPRIYRLGFRLNWR